jgi:hypothetical protein
MFGLNTRKGNIPLAKRAKVLRTASVSEKKQEFIFAFIFYFQEV